MTQQTLFDALLAADELVETIHEEHCRRQCEASDKMRAAKNEEDRLAIARSYVDWVAENYMAGRL